MFKRILAPVDGSAASQGAVAKAAGLAKVFGAEVKVIYVIDPYPFTGIGADFAYGQTQYMGAATAEAQAALNAALASLDGVSATSEVVESHAVHHGIVEAATAMSADLIVMGSHGRQGLEKLVLGSVTQRVLGNAHIPVLVVRD